MIAVHYSHHNTFGPIRRERLLKRVRLSSQSGGPLIPKHWSPKDDADERVRLKEELEELKRMEQFGYGYYTLC